MCLNPTVKESCRVVSFDDFFREKVRAFVSDASIDFTLKSPFVFSEEQRTFLRQALGEKNPGLITIRQVHGNRILVFSPLRKLSILRDCENRLKLSPKAIFLKDDSNLLTRQPSIPQADGLLTADGGVALAVRTADCLPVFIFDPIKRCIGLIHAGWRGTKEGIVKNAVTFMIEEWGSSAQNIRAAFGPAMRSCCYQVGGDFKRFFPEEIMLKEGGLYFDLPLANKRQALQMGVREEHLIDCGICTHCDHRFFSHRRQGEKAGRMISVMMLKNKNEERSIAR